jgi:hypothetical protein
MNGGTVFLVGSAGLAVYFGVQMWNADPTVVDLPIAQVQQHLANATTNFPATDVSSAGFVRPVGSDADGINVQVSMGSGSAGTRCRINLTAISADETKFTADCGAPGAEPSALAETTAQVTEALVREHARSQLTGSAFDAGRVVAAAQVAVLGNRDAMAGEALQMHDEMQAAEAEYRRTQGGAR